MSASGIWMPPAEYILSVTFNNGDQAQFALREREDVVFWLKLLVGLDKVPDGGWFVVQHTWDEERTRIVETRDLTEYFREVVK